MNCGTSSCFAGRIHTPHFLGSWHISFPCFFYLEAFSFLRAYPNNQAARKEKYGLFYRRRARSILLVRVAADPRDMLFRERASRPLFPWRFFVPGPSRQAYPRQSATVTQESPAREHL